MHRPIRIIAEESIPYLRGVLEELGEVTYLPNAQFTPDTVREADWLIIRSITKCDRALLEGSSVRLITTATAGFEHIHTDYCEKAGITWYNAPGCNAEGVGQYIGSVLAKYAIERSFSLVGKTIGIVGVGHVGTVVKRYADALGMKVLQNDPPRAIREGAEYFVSLEQIAAEADVITFHTPLTSEGEHSTFHLCDWEFVSKFARRPLVINAARGAVAASDALLRGLKEERIADLVIDCWEGEPIISRTLLERSFIGTPHIAGFSADGKCNGSKACVQHGLRFFGLHSTQLHKMTPPLPIKPQLFINHLPNDHRVERLLLETFDPTLIDATLRAQPDHFSRLRKEYQYPREPHAYEVVGDCTPSELESLQMIGFRHS